MVPFLAPLVLLAAQAAGPPPARDFDRLVATAVELHRRKRGSQAVGGIADKVR